MESPFPRVVVGCMATPWLPQALGFVPEILWRSRTTSRPYWVRANAAVQRRTANMSPR